MTRVSRRTFTCLLPSMLAIVPAALSAQTPSPGSGKQEMDRLRAAMKKSAAKGWEYVGMQRVVGSDSSTPWFGQIRTLASSSGYEVLFRRSAVSERRDTGEPESSPILQGAAFLGSPAQSVGKGGGPNSANRHRSSQGGDPDSKPSTFNLWIIEWPGVGTLSKVQQELEGGQMRQQVLPDLVGYSAKYLVATVSDTGDGYESLSRVVQALSLKSLLPERPK